MQRCSNTSSYQYCSHHPVGTCSCHLYHPHHHQSTSSHQPSKNPFTMLFSSSTNSNTRTCSTQYSNPNQQNSKSFISSNELDYHSFPIITSSSPSSAVDCTLSLGTPSTRKTSNSVVIDNHRKSTSCLTSSSKFCKSWDIFQPNKNHHQEPPRHTSSTPHNIKNIINRGYNNKDQTISRRCANCDTTSTPLWRNGPRGPKSLCNACGIRYKKEERRATASTNTSTTTTTTNVNAKGAVGEVMSHPNHHQSWTQHHSQTQPRLSASTYPTSSTTSHYHEFRFIGDDDRYQNSGVSTNNSTGGGIPNFLSWRLNAADCRQPSLVHHYT